MGEFSGSGGAALNSAQAWKLALAAREWSRSESRPPSGAALGLDPRGRPLRLPAGHPSACLSFDGDAGFRAARRPSLVLTSKASWLLDLYLPFCGAGPGRPLTVGHLGQSLDGRTATENGDSYYVTGAENIRHLHRMRALCDAVVVGAKTVECDDPQLTNRKVPGGSPARVILDPRRRLGASSQVFIRANPPTFVVCRPGAAASPRVGAARVIEVPETPLGLDLKSLLDELRERGFYFVFVEGGGLTVSHFLRQKLLDRLQIAVAPLIIGSGRPGITLPAVRRLSQALRPPARIFQMGSDVLFDCQLESGPS